MVTTPPSLATEAVTLGYGERTTSSDLTLAVPTGSFTAVVGANGCGKSTLLRALARVLRPTAGAVLLDGRAVDRLPTRQVARQLGLLPQGSVAPEGITVAELVARGRAPHQGLLQQWRSADEDAVAAALAACRLTEVSGRRVDELSGGQRQRAWVAVLLAQETPVLLLDEPTTHLDIAHQYELMDLFATLHREGRTVVAVLHDLAQAARYADHLVAMKGGRVVAAGAPTDLVTAELVEEVFGLRCLVAPDPVTGTPCVYPLQPAAAVATVRP
ncbi:ABC transporter ATP-binding protein [Quadrisphaera oryzae]|uniref:ABC transporter ATP-binding protein n=1 Tax=Quadrisphaera TaxID=317661 RepID=UPI001647C979|nr:ABC transporter ATP-binding protein [Quadrisphaera sp. RL12-1S]